MLNSHATSYQLFVFIALNYLILIICFDLVILCVDWHAQMCVCIDDDAFETVGQCRQQVLMQQRAPALQEIRGYILIYIPIP